MSNTKALLLSGYHSISQESWADYVLTTCTDYQWQSICLPPRYFSWRMRGAPLSLAAQAENLLSENYQLIVATSSIDLSVTQSIYQKLRNVPSILYFHENQFAYPDNKNSTSVVDWQMVNLYSAIRADKLIFNSNYNQQSFQEGAGKLLKKFPDLVPKNIAQALELKSSILPVPISDAVENIQTKSDIKTIRILWNHRWEWDKCPELLLHIIEALVKLNVDFKMVLTGQSFRKIPPAFESIFSRFATYIEHSGFVENKAQYYCYVRQCDVVLSTAIHEFQGIAIMEAVNNGCVPLLPKRLSYPEYFPDEFLYSSDGSLTQQADAAAQRIQYWQANNLPAIPVLKQFEQSSLVEKYRATLAN